MAATLAEVVTLYETNYRDVPMQLRKLADEIEAGDHGESPELALAMMGDKLRIFAWGKTTDAGTAHLLFAAASHALIRPLLDPE